MDNHEDRIWYWETHKVGETTIHVPIPEYQRNYTPLTRKDLTDFVESYSKSSCYGTN